MLTTAGEWPIDGKKGGPGSFRFFALHNTLIAWKLNRNYNFFDQKFSFYTAILASYQSCATLIRVALDRIQAKKNHIYGYFRSQFLTERIDT